MTPNQALQRTAPPSLSVRSSDFFRTWSLFVSRYWYSFLVAQAQSPAAQLPIWIATRMRQKDGKHTIPLHRRRRALCAGLACPHCTQRHRIPPRCRERRTT